MKKPLIVVFAHHKGGVGKSTIAIHLAVALMYHGVSVKILDTDIQKTSYHFFNNRHKNAIQPRLFKYYHLMGSAKDSREEAYKEDRKKLLNHIIRGKNDVIIIDTPGSIHNYTIEAIHRAHVLITPMNPSMFDVDALLTLDKQSIKYGNFSDIVLKARVNSNSFFKWLLIVNRHTHLRQNNSTHITKILPHIADYLRAQVINAIYDRVIFKELSGCTTIHDIIHNNEIFKLTNSNLCAYKSIEKLTDTILSIKKQWLATY